MPQPMLRYDRRSATRYLALTIVAVALMWLGAAGTWPNPTRAGLIEMICGMVGLVIGVLGFARSFRNRSAGRK